MEFDITGNLKLNTEQATQEMNRFVNQTSTSRLAQTSNVGSISSLNESTDEKLNENADYLADNFSALKDEIRKVLDSFKSLTVTLDETETKYRNNNSNRRNNSDSSSSGNSNKKDTTGIKGVREATSVMGGVSQNYINSNYGGALTSGVNSISSGFSNLSKYQSENGNKDAAKGLAVAAAGIYGVGAILNIQNSLATAYTNSLDDSSGLLRNYGRIFDNSQMNNISMKGLRASAVERSKGTGLSVDEYLAITNDMSAYGVGDFNRATNLATRIGQWNNYTGASTSTLSGYAGLVERFGGNGSKALDMAYAAANAQGLEKGQFGEFLSGLQSVIENGISKGFVKSDEEIISQLTFFTQSSGNQALWEGKYGTQRFNQMMSAGERNLSMDNTGSMLLWQSVKSVLGENATTEDIYSYIGSGKAMVDPKVLQELNKLLDNTTSGDELSKLKFIQDIFGVESPTAFDLRDKVLPNAKNYSDEQIKGILDKKKTEPEMKTDKTDIQDTKNETNEIIVEKGRLPAQANNIVGSILNAVAKEKNLEGATDKQIKKYYDKLDTFAYENKETGEIKYLNEYSPELMDVAFSKDWKKINEFSGKTAEKESNRKNAPQVEKDFYTELEKMESAKVDDRTYYSILEQYAKAYTGSTWSGDKSFDESKLQELIDTMKQINQKLEEGITE